MTPQSRALIVAVVVAVGVGALLLAHRHVTLEQGASGIATPDADGPLLSDVRPPALRQPVDSDRVQGLPGREEFGAILVRGVVRGPDMQPVPEAVVSWIPEDRARSLRPNQPEADLISDALATTTDTLGRYVLQAPAVGLIVVRKEPLSIAARWVRRALGRRQTMDFDLWRAGSIRGKVTVDGADEPIEDVEVSVSAELGASSGWSNRVIARAKVRPDGTYDVSGVPIGQYSVLPVVYGGGLAQPARSSAVNVVLAGGADVAYADFDLGYGAVVAVTVLTPSGAPVSGAHVGIRVASHEVGSQVSVFNRSRAGAAIPGAPGTYVVHGLSEAPSAVVVAEAPGRAPTSSRAPSAPGLSSIPTGRRSLEYGYCPCRTDLAVFGLKGPIRLTPGPLFYGGCPPPPSR